jgi:malonate-semialdehyde dehydrogenase (acetylating)/methylmalonate-semialdehyde dehydrogenase
MQVISPIDGSLLETLEASDAAGIDAAVTRAKEAFAAWSTTTIKSRVQPLFRFKQVVEDEIDDLAALVSSENGKTHAEAKAEIEKGVEVIEYATALSQLNAGELLEVSRGVDCHTRRFPLGVVAGITPFNFPAMVPMWMFPIAIACGNTFILKPSEQTPLSAIRLAELLREAGLPDGVFNVVHGGRDTVEALVDHAGIAAVAFVGSTPVAKAVYERGTLSGKRMLCLGGAKNHLVVVPDADPELTASNVCASATGCAGQRCMAASVLVAVGDCDGIIDSIAEHMRRIKTGTDMGAIISEAARDRIRGYIDRAEAQGAKILVDGRNVDVPDHPAGFYVGPTLIDGISPGDAVACDEVFGPVLSILRVKTLGEALAIENESPYGNAASIFTSTGATARHFEEHAGAGMIGVNIGVPVPREPFGFGGWNASRFGVGDITGSDAAALWTQTKKVTVKWTASGDANWMS